MSDSRSPVPGVGSIAEWAISDGNQVRIEGPLPNLCLATAPGREGIQTPHAQCGAAPKPLAAGPTYGGIWPAQDRSPSAPHGGIRVEYSDSGGSAVGALDLSDERKRLERE